MNYYRPLILSVLQSVNRILNINMIDTITKVMMIKGIQPVLWLKTVNDDKVLQWKSY